MDDGFGGGFFWAMAVLAAMLVGMAKGGLPAVGLLSVPLLSLTISPVAAIAPPVTVGDGVTAGPPPRRW